MVRKFESGGILLLLNQMWFNTVVVDSIELSIRGSVKEVESIEPELHMLLLFQMNCKTQLIEDYMWTDVKRRSGTFIRRLCRGQASMQTSILGHKAFVCPQMQPRTNEMSILRAYLVQVRHGLQNQYIRLPMVMQ